MTPEYIDAYQQESLGESSLFGLKIQVALGRPLNGQDSRAIRAAAEQLEQALRAETLRLDPDVQKRRAGERQSILALFDGLSIIIYVQEIANGYCPKWCCSQRPWFLVTTPKGVITLGWRKRVLEIRWEGSDITQTAEELFPQEEVTKQGRMIHAWSYDKAREYIAVLFQEKEAQP